MKKSFSPKKVKKSRIAELGKEFSSNATLDFGRSCTFASVGKSESLDWSPGTILMLKEEGVERGVDGFCIELL